FDVQRLDRDAVPGARFDGETADELVAQVDDGIFAFADLVMFADLADALEPAEVPRLAARINDLGFAVQFFEQCRAAEVDLDLSRSADKDDGRAFVICGDPAFVDGDVLVPIPEGDLLDEIRG